jgi:hypothetical protein
METVDMMHVFQTAPALAYAPGNQFLTKQNTLHQLVGGGQGKS